MATVITLPDELSERLKPQAAEQHMALDAYVIDVLRRMSDQSTATIYVEPLEAILARIKTLPPMAPTPYPGIDTPTHALADYVYDAGFDAADWDRQWAVVETKIKSAARADRLADDRA